MAKKKIVLIHPQGENWVAGETDMTRIANIMPPIGLCSLAAWVDQHGHQSFIHDCYAFPGDDQLYMDLIETEEPEFVGLTATTSAFLDAVRIAKKVKQRFPNVKILLGGAHISALRNEVMEKFPVIDFGVVGEGENTLLKLMEWD
ncbi:MAG: cobalamin-dependent protein, partial [Gammaproteobacteria bacterium]